MNLRCTVALFAAGWFAPTLQAQTAPAVPTSVNSVQAGGYWATTGREGQYRLIIESGGYEHIVSRAFLQWLAQPGTSKDSMVVVASIVIPELDTGIWQLDSPRFEIHGSNWQALVDGSNARIQPAAKARWRLTLGPPGKYSITAEPTAP